MTNEENIIHMQKIIKQFDEVINNFIENTKIDQDQKALIILNTLVNYIAMIINIMIIDDPNSRQEFINRIPTQINEILEKIKINADCH